MILGKGGNACICYTLSCCYSGFFFFFFFSLRNKNLLPYLSSINLLTSHLFPLVSRGILATCIICSPCPAECFISYKNPGIWFIVSSPCLVSTNFRGYLCLCGQSRQYLASEFFNVFNCTINCNLFHPPVSVITLELLAFWSFTLCYSDKNMTVTFLLSHQTYYTPIKPVLRYSHFRQCFSLCPSASPVHTCFPF